MLMILGLTTGVVLAGFGFVTGQARLSVAVSPVVIARHENG